MYGDEQNLGLGERQGNKFSAMPFVRSSDRDCKTRSTTLVPTPVARTAAAKYLLADPNCMEELLLIMLGIWK